MKVFFTYFSQSSSCFLFVLSAIYGCESTYSPRVCVPRILKSKICPPGAQKTWLVSSRHPEKGNFCLQSSRVLQPLPSSLWTRSEMLLFFPPRHSGHFDTCLIFCFANEWLTDPVDITTARGPYVFVSPVLTALFLFTLGSYNENFSCFCPSPRGAHVDCYIPHSTVKKNSFLHQFQR